VTRESVKAIPHNCWVGGYLILIEDLIRRCTK